MKQEWMRLAELARARHMTDEAARHLAEREHWPMVFKQHATFVLPTPANCRPPTVRRSV